MSWSVGSAKFWGVGLNKSDRDTVWHLGRHVHPHHELIVVMEGSQRVRIDGRDVRGYAGEVLFYRAGVHHEEWQEPGHSLLTLFMTFACDSIPQAMPVCLRDTERRIRTMSGWMRDERLRESPVSEDLQQSYLNAIIAEMVRLWRFGHGGLVSDTRHYIRENIEDHMTLDGLADMNGMSKYHFIRRYKALAGRTPMEDVRMLRLDHARDMILTTSIPLKEIASKTGLGDVYHMSRLFRRCLGFAPGSLRKHAPE
jgi:AraC-like DNA-binding protein